MPEAVQDASPAGVYAIRLQGILPLEWSDWFGGMTIRHDEQGNTTLTGALADQAGLFELLGKTRDLGLELLSITRLEEAK